MAKSRVGAKSIKRIILATIILGSTLLSVESIHSIEVEKQELYDLKVAQMTEVKGQVNEFRDTKLEEIRIQREEEARKAEEERLRKEEEERQRLEEEQRKLEEQKRLEAQRVSQQASYTSEPQQPQGIQITNRSADDYYPDSGEVIGIISIPSIGMYLPVHYGDDQANIDKYDVNIRTGWRFNGNGNVLVAGHNYKAFGALFNINPGDKIYVHTYYGDFTFQVDWAKVGTTDGKNVYDENGNEMIDFFSYTNSLKMYTCAYSGADSRLVVSAHMI